MAAKAISILCLLLCAQVFAVRNLETTVSRSLKQQTITGTSANIDGFLDIEGPASVDIVATATGEAVAVARNALAVAFAGAVAEVEGGGDAIAIAEVQANAFALAVAQALAEAFIFVDVDGDGVATCIRAASSAEATATAVAEVIVAVLAQASNDIDFASVTFAVNAIVAATASAYADADAQVCGIGPFTAEAYASVLSTAIAQPFIQVFVAALALVTPGASVAQLLVQANAGVLEVVTVDGRTAVDVIGEAEANANIDGDASVN